MTQPALDLPIAAGEPAAAVPLIPAGVSATPPAVTPPAPAAAPTQPAATQPTAVQPPPAAVELDPRLVAQEAELAYYRRETANRSLRDKAIAYKAQLETDGWPPELAVIHTKTWLEKEVANSQRDAANGQYEEACRQAVASRLGQQFGVKGESLLAYTTPQSMFEAAQRIGSEGKRVAALEAEIAALKSGRVPAQTFAPAGGAPGSSDDTFITQYSQGQSQDHARAKKLLGL